jgi:type I restriction enzyme R subunit
VGIKGKLWADDYYDRAIRSEKHFWVVYEYIKNNPQKISGTKFPPSIGTDTLVSENNDGTKVPPPIGTDTLVSKNNNGTKVPLPRFYGIFE